MSYDKLANRQTLNLIRIGSREGSQRSLRKKHLAEEFDFRKKPPPPKKSNYYNRNELY